MGSRGLAYSGRMLFEGVDNNDLFIPRSKLRTECSKSKNINFEYIHRGLFINTKIPACCLETNLADLFDDHPHAYPTIPSSFSSDFSFTFCTKYCYNFNNIFTCIRLRVATKGLHSLDELSINDFSKLELGSEIKIIHDACDHNLLVLNSISTSKVFVNISTICYSCTKCNLCRGKQGLYLLNDYFINGPKLICTSCLDVFIERVNGDITFENLF